MSRGRNSDLDLITPEVAVDLYLDQRRNELNEQTLQSHRYRLNQFIARCKDKGIINMNGVSGRDLHVYRVHRSEKGELKVISLQGQLSTLRPAGEQTELPGFRAMRRRVRPRDAAVTQASQRMAPPRRPVGCTPVASQ